MVVKERDRFNRAEKKKKKNDTRGARAHAGINMSKSFFENAIMGFVTVTHTADLSHNYVTSGRTSCLPARTLRSQWPAVGGRYIWRRHTSS